MPSLHEVLKAKARKWEYVLVRYFPVLIFYHPKCISCGSLEPRVGEFYSDPQQFVVQSSDLDNI